MDVAEVRDQLARINGIAERSELICSDYWLARAVAEGVIHRVACGRYALPGIASAERAALSAGGVLSHGSAAVAYGWSVLVPPARPQVMVPRGRKLTTGRVAADVRWGVLSDAERKARLTTPLRTVVDCCRTLPFVEALGIADAALRSGAVGPEELIAAAQRHRGPGRAQVLRVARHASPGAANAFESGMRAILLDIPQFRMSVQVVIGEPGRFVGRVDLADVELGVVVECDGYETHGTRQGFRKDRARYAGLGMLDWIVFTYVWEDVATTPEATRAELQRWAERQVARYPRGRAGDVQ